MAAAERVVGWAAVRFISAEPLLGPVDIAPYFIETDLQYPGFVKSKRYEDGYCNRCAGHISDPCHHSPAGLLDWVICGGESGPNARPMHPDWARGLRDQCVAAGVPFFFKQWGEFAPRCAGINDHAGWDGMTMQPVGKKAAGDLLDGVQWHQFPEVRA